MVAIARPSTKADKGGLSSLFERKLKIDKLDKILAQRSSTITKKSPRHCRRFQKNKFDITRPIPSAMLTMTSTEFNEKQADICLNKTTPLTTSDHYLRLGPYNSLHLRTWTSTSSDPVITNLVSVLNTTSTSMIPMDVQQKMRFYINSGAIYMQAFEIEEPKVGGNITDSGIANLLSGVSGMNLDTKEEKGDVMKGSTRALEVF